MRPALRLLASVSRANSRELLEPGAPTGLTGLFTHHAPRSTLLYLYSDTLNKLQQFPESSVYRQSTEALTKHRMRIIEANKPAGLEEWQARVNKLVEEHPEAFKKVPLTSSSGKMEEFNIVWKDHALQGAATPEWGDETPGPAMLEGPRDQKTQELQHAQLARDPVAEHAAIPRIEPEPPLSVEQIQGIENEIQAGLIEEIIEVAEGERNLVDTLAEAKIWEDLEEKPREGQWTYHERDTHTPMTQAR
ncbi:ETC complex I subunit conserved region [Teratosphaeria destructans]|uniref:ETC complex I subunit conserved region n=1 Tax=Teratosphaeria destructans TaxID=418781 RepID=A0A9W7SL89_9PEZI|nr:ETC complex I subunit conserved region [Teratosphaeria destructans]